MNSWTSEKPSNIALIKYMGKLDNSKNKPTNASLSWTLNHLNTKVKIEISQKNEDQWQAMETQFPFKMSPKGIEKYLSHFARIKKYFGVEHKFLISSGNNFPADCGIASSASSFAALTDVACKAFSEITSKEVSIYEMANLSALGSGSSCRSFLKNWVLWNGNEITKIDTEIDNLLHMVVIIGDQTKKVSSSEAHKRVPSSLLFKGRSDRANHRLEEFINNSQNLNWSKLFQIGWEEFMDMHALFETSRPSFGYFLDGTHSFLNSVRFFWESEGDGPLVTMDAGPNIHLLWRQDQKKKAQDFHNKYILGQWKCLSNIEGIEFV
jgi:diphosphomevalonate decarboxylase